MESGRINLDRPRWNQGTFYGRLKYFAWITDPRLTITPTSELMNAKILLQKYRNQQEPAGTTINQIRRAQQLYLSAFHPDSGDLQNVIGRMSFFVPGGMILVGAMISFYKSTAAVIFWQWANQSFNALVNYTNRNAASEITTKQMAAAYVSATSSALVTAIGLKQLLAQRASPLVQRFVPFTAVAAANIINIPLMRQSELIDGITVYDENNNKITQSRYAAIKGISQVVLSRIIIVVPSMTVLPILIERLEKTNWMKRYPVVNAPLQIALAGLTMLFMVPIGCALFPQTCSSVLEELQEQQNF
ncbi:hypothetical protein LOTGIDRAFT_231295 [Lottia gigantea]|uniref:Sidoreflexin n=1 Tax=Lottia gigantea TaxID=225164 RepID=V4A506_LOTGI|nr:hypothetical protein LOTGIDRAFT_231295 [Lottia gigantea]ESO98978.1 hypothetical protein LOTGIDRAFT_231295 [Lottia gigantea]